MHVKSSQRVVEAMLQIWDETLGQPNNSPRVHALRHLTPTNIQN